MKFNLHGRVNLVYLIGFGLFGLLWFMIYPDFLNILHKIFGNNNLFMVISLVMMFFMIYNMCISFSCLLTLCYYFQFGFLILELLMCDYHNLF